MNWNTEIIILINAFHVVSVFNLVKRQKTITRRIHDLIVHGQGSILMYLKREFPQFPPQIHYENDISTYITYLLTL